VTSICRFVSFIISTAFVVGAKPMTYMLDGKQYIVVSIGRPGPAELVALALPE
jgi:hypothetical protein